MAIEREEPALVGVPLPEDLDANINFWDPRLGANNKRLTPMEDLEEVKICPSTHQVTKIGTSFSEEEEHKLVDQLIRNINLFAWDPSDMPKIDTRVICHHLNIDPSTKPVAQRK